MGRTDAIICYFDSLISKLVAIVATHLIYSKSFGQELNLLELSSHQRCESSFRGKEGREGGGGMQTSRV